jgi:hypothetical protein
LNNILDRLLVIINKNTLYLYVMTNMFKKYHFFLLVSILLISIVSCRKGGEPVPSFDNVEVISSDDSNSSVKDVEPGDKGGGEVVGGDDNEDDDGGDATGGSGSDGDGDGVKGGTGGGEPSQGSGSSSKAG